jgi:hypothetical protein
MTVMVCNYNMIKRDTFRDIISLTNIPDSPTTFVLLDSKGHTYTVEMDGSEYRYLKIDY